MQKQIKPHSVKKLVIWGASGHALVVADITRLTGLYEIVGFLDDLNREKYGNPFCGASVLGGREQLDRLLGEGICDAIVAIGNCAVRLKLAEFMQSKRFRLATVIHPRATVAEGVSIGAGTVICAGAVINVGAHIGENVIVNTNATVDHECMIEDGVHIGPASCLGGKVSVGKATWVGMGVLVKDHVSIGSGSVIGAGAVVLKDIPEQVVVYGVPAKIMEQAAVNEIKKSHR